MMPPPPPKKKLSGCQIALIVLGLIAVCSIIGTIATPQSSITANNNVTDTSTVQPTDTPTAGSSFHIAPVSGAPLIGANIGTLVAQYGEPQDGSTDYYVFKYENGKDHLTVWTENHRIRDMIVDTLGPQDISPSTAKSNCLAYAPPDSQYKRRYDLLDSQNTLSETVYVYYSPSLASKFSVKDFYDENSNQTTAGIFGVGVNYDLSDTSMALNCSIGPGLDSDITVVNRHG